jgi:hypothetical protein
LGMAVEVRQESVDCAYESIIVRFDFLQNQNE